MERKELPIEMQSFDGLGEREFACTASTWVPYVDTYGDMIQKGAFVKWLPFFLEKGVSCWQHATRQPIGRPLEARETDAGLYARIKISQVAQGDEALTLMRDKVVQSVSIMYDVLGYEMVSESRARELLGDHYDAAMRALPWWSDGLRLLTEIKLYGIDPVTFPGNEQAEILAVRSSGRLPETEREFERFLRDAGFPRKAAAAITARGYKDAALQRDAEGDAAAVEALAGKLQELTSALRAS